MAENKRLFVVSDVHGHCSILKKALEDAGFDENNDNHVFVSCGDLFDRGKENKEVYDYICSLKRKILICGNHDEHLAEIIASQRIKDYDYANGTDNTIREFFGLNCIGVCGELSLSGKESVARELQKFISDMRDYYETENYIFVHGWLPIEVYDRVPKVIENWRTADKEEWSNARMLEWQQLYGTQAMVLGKTIVCGHRTAGLAHLFDCSRHASDSNIFYGNGLRVLDAGTITSKRINVLVIDEKVEL